MSVNTLILHPRGGEVFPIGSSQYVVLNPAAVGAPIKVELSYDGGATFEVLGTVFTPNLGEDPPQFSNPNALKFEISPGRSPSHRCIVRASMLGIVAVTPAFSIGLMAGQSGLRLESREDGSHDYFAFRAINGTLKLERKDGNLIKQVLQAQSDGDVVVFGQGKIGLGYYSPIPMSSRINLLSSVSEKVDTVTDDVTLGDDHSVVLANSAATINVRLPQASLAHGRRYTIKRLGPGSVHVKVTAEPDRLDGQMSRSLGAQYDFMTVISDGKSWSIINR